jgi:hypothetical protein
LWRKGHAMRRSLLKTYASVEGWHFSLALF